MDDIAQLYDKVITHVTVLFLYRDVKTLKKILNTKGKPKNDMVAEISIQESLSNTPHYPKPIGKELEAILEKLSSKATLTISPKTALIDSKSTKIKRVKNNKILKHE